MSALVNEQAALKVMTADRTSGGNWVPIQFLASYMNYVPAVEPENFDACPILLTQPAEDHRRSQGFDSLLEARVIIEDWRCDYNANRPHSAHGELTPTEFALQWTTTHQPQVA
jgi:transposase InsO family protein